MSPEEGQRVVRMTGCGEDWVMGLRKEEDEVFVMSFILMSHVDAGEIDRD